MQKRTSTPQISDTASAIPEQDEIPYVVGVQIGRAHSFNKAPRNSIKLVENFGVEGDTHAGAPDQHLFHIKRYGDQPNSRQVHLIQTEFFDEVLELGHMVRAGDLGENISTRHIDLLSLPTRTRIRFGTEAVVELTGLRNPCHQIENFQGGLLKHCKVSTPAGVIRKAGVMGIVLHGGTVRISDTLEVELPPEPHQRLVYRVPKTSDR